MNRITNLQQFKLPKDQLKLFFRSKSEEWLHSWFHMFTLEHPGQLDANERISLRNFIGFEIGVREGWWEDWNESGPIPFPKNFSITELGEGATIANVVVGLGLFPSINQARKNGFNAPLTLGTFEFTKKKIRVRIVP